MEQTFSHKNAATDRKPPESLSLGKFIPWMAFYSAIMSALFAVSTSIGRVWLHPDWFAPVACLALSFICMYAAHRKEESLGTFASVLGTVVFNGLAIGAATALGVWPEQVFVVVMLTTTVVFSVSAIGIPFPAVCRGWALVVTWGMTLFAFIMLWEFSAQVAQVRSLPFTEISLGWWLWSIFYALLTFGLWTHAIEEVRWHNHNDAILVSGGVPLALFGLLFHTKGTVDELLGDDEDD